MCKSPRSKMVRGAITATRQRKPRLPGLGAQDVSVNQAQIGPRLQLKVDGQVAGHLAANFSPVGWHSVGRQPMVFAISPYFPNGKLPATWPPSHRLSCPLLCSPGIAVQRRGERFAQQLHSNFAQERRSQYGVGWPRPVSWATPLPTSSTPPAIPQEQIDHFLFCVFGNDCPD